MHKGCMGISKKKSTGDDVEQKVVALAEQLGWFLGTVQAKADGWLDRTALRKEVRRIRGAVDAPGKRHRKPPPQEPIDKRMGEPVGKKMGQKNFKMGAGRGRG